MRAGRSAPHALMMMIPEAFGPSYHISTDKRAFYEYHAAIMEPWDGPAAMVFTDGRLVGGTLDRNGLRPSRYVVTTDGLVVLASEVGVIEFPPEKIQQKGPSSARPHVPGRYRGGPDRRATTRSRARSPGRSRIAAGWRRTASSCAGCSSRRKPRRVDPKTLAQRLRAFGYTREDLQMILAPMAANGQEPVGSMGTDTPLAVLSERPKLLFHYFKQLFAQVTNPPIDPLREGLVMSLMAFTGKQRNLLDETPEHCRQLKLPHPILTNDDMQRLRTANRPRFQGGDAAGAVLRPTPPIPAEALARPGRTGRRGRGGAIHDGASLLILSDRDMSPERAAIPSLLATAALHHGLLARRLRSEAGIVVESGEPREVMHFCLLVRLRGQRHQSLPGLRGHPQAACRRRPAGRRAGRSTRRPVHHGREEGHSQDDVEDGHLHACGATTPRSSSRRWA